MSLNIETENKQMYCALKSNFLVKDYRLLISLGIWYSVVVIGVKKRASKPGSISLASICIYFRFML